MLFSSSQTAHEGLGYFAERRIISFQSWYCMSAVIRSKRRFLKLLAFSYCFVYLYVQLLHYRQICTDSITFGAEFGVRRSAKKKICSPPN